MPMSRFGAALFQFLAPLQLVLAVFFAAIATASAVAHEKDRRTLVLLLLTNLSNTELVLGKLRLHGLRSARLGQALTMAQSDIELFRTTGHTIRPEPYEGRHRVDVKGSWQAAATPIPLHAGAARYYRERELFP